ncbi:Sodium-coupled monocarboxylate transporter 1 [Portunus trituberculatus]|uniref:Sodium-coupled monocarboxylate transporter 1 n=1 Tax=Portunus trituberculatus TaxID=210409 RepID=A0A5B7DCM6_PORTR|nr:Sodium-coupled monocarboxylate transporter 1 [Portunus trituberculatus]
MGAAVVQWNHACFGILEVSKRTGSNPVHGLSVTLPNVKRTENELAVVAAPRCTRGNAQAKLTDAVEYLLEIRNICMESSISVNIAQFEWRKDDCLTRHLKNLFLKSGWMAGCPSVNPDPLQRHSLWLVIVQGYFLVLLVSGMGQPQVQRICSVSTWRKAIGAHYLNVFIFIISMICFYLLGLSVYAVYADCDPLATGEISKADQLVPYYVSDRLSGYYGLSGLFIASLYAATPPSLFCRSSYSSQINAISAILWEDFFKDSSWVSSMKEERRPYVNVLVSAITGTLGVVAGIVSMQVGGVFQAGQTILGTINAPQLGLFLLGMCCPFANKIGGMVGMATSFAFNLWVTLGSMFNRGPVETLDFSDDGCSPSTSPNSSFSPTFPFTESRSTYSTSFVPPTEPPQE